MFLRKHNVSILNLILSIYDGVKNIFDKKMLYLNIIKMHFFFFNLCFIAYEIVIKLFEK